MIPANGVPHDLEARDVLRSSSFAQRRARDRSADELPAVSSTRRQSFGLTFRNAMWRVPGSGDFIVDRRIHRQSSD
jgi:hypothetical protein